jgi:hypothetical protein
MLPKKEAMANTLDFTRAVRKSPDMLPVTVRSNGGLLSMLYSSGALLQRSANCEVLELAQI